MDTIELAKKIATEAHRGQFRRNGKTPYIKHPKAVAKELEQYYLMRETYLPVAWLHDVLENTDLHILDLLHRGIPFEIAAAVEALTKRDDEDYLQYILRVRRNPIAIMVKIADMKDNSKTATESQKTKYLLAKHILEH